MLLQIVGVIELLRVNVGVRAAIAAASQATEPVAALIILPQVVQAGF